MKNDSPPPWFIALVFVSWGACSPTDSTTESASTNHHAADREVAAPSGGSSGLAASASSGGALMDAVNPSGGVSPVPSDPESPPKMSLPPVSGWVAPSWERFAEEGPVGRNLGDFSYAGYHRGEKEIPPVAVVANASEYGVVSNDGTDDTDALMAAIDAAHQSGGGAVLLPAGRIDIDGDEHVIRIKHSGIVLRGAGSQEGGTVLFLNRHIGHDREDAAVVFEGSAAYTGLTQGMGEITRGESVLEVASTSSLQAGEMIQIVIRSPGSELPGALTAPFELNSSLSTTLDTNEVFWTVEVAEIVDETHLRLVQPFRFDVPATWEVELWSQSMISEVGLEGLRLESAWPGDFQHHKPSGDRSANEQDYLWQAVMFQRVYNGWVRDVSISGYNQGVAVRRSKAITIEDVSNDGIAGHTFITFSRSHDNLARRTEVHAAVVHAYFHAAYSSGNVVTDATLTYGPYDDYSGTDRLLDFHGLFPFENLCEKIRDAYVLPGGATSYLPHAGVRNVFWDVRAPEEMNRWSPGSEFFRTYASTSSGAPASTHAFEHWPQAFVVGVHRSGNDPLTIAQETTDRADEWLTVEGLNQAGVWPPSLYEAQWITRMNR